MVSKVPRPSQDGRALVIPNYKISCIGLGLQLKRTIHIDLKVIRWHEIFIFWSLLKTFFTKRPTPKRFSKIDHF